MLYFDHNATHPLLPSAREAWLNAATTITANPSSPHRPGTRASNALEDARTRLATILRCESRDIVWTGGATEAVNTAIRHFSLADPMGEIWFSEIEHPCTLGAAARWFEGRICSLPATRRGVLDLDHLRERLKTARPGLVAVMAANNETGILQPWREAGDLCREQGVPFLCDAAQWMGRLPAAGLGECTAVAGCAHKFGGPLGVGFLKGPERMSPLLVGGPQEDARRAGTENLPGILGMLAALEECEGKLAIAVPVSPRDTFIRALLEALPGTEIVGAGGDRLWNTVTAILPAPIDCRQRWVVKLDRAGCAASTGSACASGKEQTSHVLAAQGISPEQAGRTIRFSAGWSTTEGDWADLLAIIQKAALSMRTMDGEG